MCILNQRNIKAFGRMWNSFEEVYFYEKHLENNSINFEMMKLREYEGKKKLGDRINLEIKVSDVLKQNMKEIIIEHNDLSMFVKTVVFNEECQGKMVSGLQVYDVIDENKAEQRDEILMSSSILASQSFDSQKRIKTHTEGFESFDSQKRVENFVEGLESFDDINLYEIQGNLEVSSELIINNYIYLVQEANNGTFLTIE